MAIEHDWRPSGLHIHYLDFVSGENLIADALAVSGDERFDDLRYIVSDWSGCTETKISTEDVEVLAAYVSAMARSNPRIVNLNIMKPDVNNQAFINFYMFLTSEVPWKVLAFHSLLEADDWLRENASKLG